MNPMEAIHEVSVWERSQCTVRAAMMKPMRPTSMASSAQPMPEPVSSFVCFLVTGSRSRRSVRLSDPVETGVGDDGDGGVVSMTDQGTLTVA